MTENDEEIVKLKKMGYNINVMQVTRTQEPLIRKCEPWRDLRVVLAIAPPHYSHCCSAASLFLRCILVFC